jgi:PAS domain S-box-containing protein
MQKILIMRPGLGPIGEWIRRIPHIVPGCNVLTTQSGKDGLDNAPLHQPDLIVINEPLPDFDSFFVIQKLKAAETTKNIPIILLKQEREQNETPEELGYDDLAGVDVFLEKPISELVFQTQIKTLLKFKKTEDNLEFQQNILEESVLRRTELLERELLEYKKKEFEWLKRDIEYRDMVQASNEGMYLLYNGKFQILNKKFLEMFAFDRDKYDWNELSLSDLVIPKCRPFLEEWLNKIQRGETADGKHEFTARALDGREFELEASAAKIKYKYGTAIQGVVRDVTDRKYIERQLRQANKIEAISRLAGGIAHDFNNILAIIRGYTELSLDDLEFCENKGLQRNLFHVLEASDRARDLVNQILTFSRQTDEELQPVPVGRIAREVLRLLKPSLPQNMEIVDEIGSDEGIVMADPTQLRRVVVNLCTNAVHAMKENGGQLKLKLEKVVLRQHQLTRLEDLEPGKYIKLTVSDTGHGMEHDVMERVFDPYFTTKPTGEGSGMGLSVIHGLIKKYGGVIQVKSQPEKGTDFILYLPLQESVPVTEAMTSVILGGKERILFVEDETLLLHTQQVSLERLGYDVVAIANSQEALDSFKEAPEIFDMVITDQSMPGMTGMELSKKILEIRPELPIILCTGFSETINRQKVLNTGIKEFIIKPIIRKEMAGIIRKLLKKENSEGINDDKTGKPNLEEM